MTPAVKSLRSAISAAFTLTALSLAAPGCAAGARARVDVALRQVPANEPAE